MLNFKIHFEMSGKKMKTSMTNGDSDGNSSQIDELTTAISMMADDITKLARGQSCFKDLLITIQVLQKENDVENLWIKTLEKRIDDLEQYSIWGNMILSRLNVHH